MQTNLQGKTVLVADAMHNFGPATALAFAQEGCSLLLASPEDGEPGREIAQQAQSLGVTVTTRVCDLSNEAQVRELVLLGKEQFRHIDILVNNVLLPTPMQSLADVTFDMWQRKMATEITGAFYLCKEVLPGMIELGWGRIINYTGLAAFQGTDALSSATELGIVGLTRGIAREYGKYNITANCIGPGGISAEDDARQVCYPPRESDGITRWGRPDGVAFLAIALASEDAGYLTGQCLLANGGKYFL